MKHFSQSGSLLLVAEHFICPATGFMANLLGGGRRYATIVVLDFFCVWLSALAFMIVLQAGLGLGAWWWSALGH
jgi:hypothetical protein